MKTVTRQLTNRVKDARKRLENYRAQYAAGTAVPMPANVEEFNTAVAALEKSITDMENEFKAKNESYTSMDQQDASNTVDELVRQIADIANKKYLVEADADFFKTQTAQFLLEASDDNKDQASRDLAAAAIAGSREAEAAARK